MAKFFLDTSVLVHYVRGSTLALHINNTYSPSTAPNYSLVPVVSLGEMYSFSYRLSWGTKKQELLKKILSSIPAVDINHQQIIDQFAEMDAYRLGKHPEKPLPPGETSKVSVIMIYG